ncbi:MAG: hypothetical protein ABIP74_02505 [Candidatus Saccharimonas sp.]
MRLSLKLTMIGLLAAVGIATTPLQAAYAADCTTAADCATKGVKSAGGSGSTASVGDIIKTIVNVLLFILGAVAVIMIILGGIRYTISQGDSTAITSAKNTILYAVIGLVVALLAYAIVNFVISQFV